MRYKRESTIKKFKTVHFGLLVLISVIFSVNVLVASSIVTKSLYVQFRGINTMPTSTTVALGKDYSVNLEAKLTLMVDPNTAAHMINCRGELWRNTWYGHDILLSVPVATSRLEVNMTNNIMTTYYLGRGSATVSTTADYYCVGITLDVSDAFYSRYDFTIIYTIP